MHQARSLSLAARIRRLRIDLAALEELQRADFRAAIALVIGPGVLFSARELWEHRLVSPALASAFHELGIRSPRQLGKKLRQLGFERVGVDEHGAVWLVG